MRPRARSNKPSLEDSIITGICTENLVVLDERAGLIAIETRHHDINENDVGLMVRDLRERIESVDGGEYLAPLLGEQRFGGTADRFAVVDDQHLQALELRVVAGHGAEISCHVGVRGYCGTKDA